MFKEANKQSSNIDITYKTHSLRCLADLVQFSSTHFKETYFESFWQSFVKKYFDAELEVFTKKEKLRQSQQFHQFKEMNNIADEKESPGETATEDVEMETETKESKESNEDKEEKKEAENEEMVIKLILLETIGRCWPFSTESQGEFLISMFLNSFKYNF